MDKTVRQAIEFQSTLTDLLKVIGSGWENLNPEQRKVMRQLENVIDDAISVDDARIASDCVIR